MYFISYFVAVYFFIEFRFFFLWFKTTGFSSSSYHYRFSVCLSKNAIAFAATLFKITEIKNPNKYLNDITETHTTSTFEARMIGVICIIKYFLRHTYQPLRARPITFYHFQVAGFLESATNNQHDIQRHIINGRIWNEINDEKTLSIVVKKNAFEHRAHRKSVLFDWFEILEIDTHKKKTTKWSNPMHIIWDSERWRCGVA